MVAVAGLLATLEQLRVVGNPPDLGRPPDADTRRPDGRLAIDAVSVAPVWREFLAEVLTPGNRYLVVTARNQPSLHRFFRQALADVDSVDVIQDRRIRPRRQRRGSAAVERRRGDRRSRSDAEAELRFLGFTFVHLPEATGRLPQRGP